MARLTLSLAVLFAAADLLARAIQKLGFEQVVRLPRAAFWVVPLGYLLLFAPAALIVWLAGRVWPRAGSRAVLVLVLGLPAIVGILSLIPLHRIGVLALAAGLAVQLARVAKARGRNFDRVAWAAARPAALLLALAAIAVPVASRVAEARAIARLPAAPDGAPNVLLLIWDTVRAASLGLHGYDRPTTPNLERLAREGTTFLNAYATAPWTLPSHASMFTGRIPDDLSVGWLRPLDDRDATLAEVLAGNGYRTAGFAANVLYADWEHGLARGFQHYEDYRITPGQVLSAPAFGRLLLRGPAGWGASTFRRVLGDDRFIGRASAAQIDARLLRWIDRAGDRPWFVFANYFDAHLPYHPPQPFAGRFGPQHPRSTLLGRVRQELRGGGFWNMSADSLAAQRAAYEASIAALDAQLGRLLDELDRRGLRDSTLIVITSDHGEEFGEHDDFEHGSNLYGWQLHVPLLIVAPPRVPVRMRVADFVSLRDLPATIADLALPDRPEPFPGASLARYWRSDAPQPFADDMLVVSELVPGREPDQRMRSLILEPWQLITNPDSSLELYDLRNDPVQRRDLAGTPVHAATARFMSAQLRRAIDCHGFDCCCAIPRPAENRRAGGAE